MLLGTPYIEDEQSLYSETGLSCGHMDLVKHGSLLSWTGPCPGNACEAYNSAQVHAGIGMGV